MKTRFYFIRHGETAWNKKGIYQGWTDIELSEEGLMQAELLGKRFRHLHVDAVYSSPLKRAMATARPVAETAGVTVIADEHFKEINFGEWEGHSVPELSEKYGAAFQNFFDDPFSYPFPGEGSFDKVSKRALEGYYRLLEKHRGQSVAVISHGGLLRVLIMGIVGMDNSFYRKTWLSNTALSVVDVTEDNKTLLFTLNDKAHLEMGGMV